MSPSRTTILLTNSLHPRHRRHRHPCPPRAPRPKSVATPTATEATTSSSRRDKPDLRQRQGPWPASPTTHHRQTRDPDCDNVIDTVCRAAETAVLPPSTTTTTGNIGHAVGRDLRGATLSSPPPTPPPPSRTPLALARGPRITRPVHPVGQGPGIDAAVGKQYGPPQPAILWRGGDRLSAGRCCGDVEGQQRHRVRVPDGPSQCLRDRLHGRRCREYSGRFVIVM